MRHFSEAPSHPDMNRSQSDLIYDGLRVQLEPAPFWPRALALCIDLSLLYFATLAMFFVALLVVLFVAVSLGYTLESMGLGGNAATRIILVVVVAVMLLSLMGVTHGYFIYSILRTVLSEG